MNVRKINYYIVHRTLILVLYAILRVECGDSSLES